MSITCKHLRRTYDPEPKPGELLRFECWDCARIITSEIKWTDKISITDLCDCPCEEFQLCQSEWDIISPFSDNKDKTEKWLRLKCTTCGAPVVQLRKVDDALQPFGEIFTSLKHNVTFHRPKKQCEHPRRCYHPQPKLGECLLFHCYDCCHDIISTQQWTETLTLRDLFHCPCVQYGLPTFAVFRFEIMSPFSKQLENWMELKCLRCSTLFIQVPNVEEDLEQPFRRLLTTGEKGKEFRRVKVTNIAQLFQSDHIFWIRCRGLYEHHAMILFTKDQQGVFNVVHYTSVSSGGTNSLFHILVDVNCSRANMSFEGEKETLYKVEYLPLDTLPFYETVDRAKDAQGMVYYDIFFNNCESFVRRIKSDLSISLQVQKDLKKLKGQYE